MVKSSFSGREIPPGTGMMYVKKDGKILYFLNKKEEKNMLKLGRKARKIGWTEDYRKEKGQRIAVAQHAAEHAHKEDVVAQKAPAKKAAPKAPAKAATKAPVKKAPAKKTPAKKAAPKEKK